MMSELKKSLRKKNAADPSFESPTEKESEDDLQKKLVSFIFFVISEYVYFETI